MKKLQLILFVLLSITSLGQKASKFGVSESTIPEGVDVGDTIENLKLNFLSDEVIELYQFASEKPTVILFYRGEWCPVCNKYLSNLSDSLSLIEEHANVIVIAPETRVNMQNTKEEHPQFTYVLDESGEIMEEFKVWFEVTDKYQKKIKTFLRTEISEHNNQEVAKLPVPATFIISSTGVVIYKHFNLDYSIRASAAEILNALKK